MISDLRLQQFRSYSDASFEFGNGVNIIVGPNGSGKTNLLEALLVLAHGSSYRVNDADLIQFEKDWLRLDAHLEPGDSLRTVKLITNPRQSKTYELDGKMYQRLTLQHTLPVVLAIDLVGGGNDVAVDLALGELRQEVLHIDFGSTDHVGKIEPDAVGDPRRPSGGRHHTYPDGDLRNNAQQRIRRSVVRKPSTR